MFMPNVQQLAANWESSDEFPTGLSVTYLLMLIFRHT